ncbi:hypothetical protein ACFQ3Z_21865 [Streptomyces nogalater]
MRLGRRTIDRRDRHRPRRAHRQRLQLVPRACRRCTRSAVRAARDTHPARCTDCKGPTALCDTRQALHELLLELRR